MSNCGDFLCLRSFQKKEEILSSIKINNEISFFKKLKLGVVLFQKSCFKINY